MTSQAPCRYVHNILITYDENKAKADVPTILGVSIIQLQHMRNYFFLDLVNQKSLSYIIRTLKKKKTHCNWYYY